jgi:hypothetical protein
MSKSALNKRLDRRRERRDYFAALSRHSDSDDSVASENDVSISDQPDPSDDLVLFAADDQCSSESDSSNTAVLGKHASYKPDEDDNIHGDERTFEQSKDDSSLLYPDADVSTKAGISAILQFAIECSLSKVHTTKLFDLIRSLLPTPNKLPTTQVQLLKLFDRPPSKFLFRITFFAEHRVPNGSLCSSHPSVLISLLLQRMQSNNRIERLHLPHV